MDRRRDRKYRTLFEAAHDGIFILGEEGFLDCNQRGAAMYGLPKDQVLGRSPLDFAPREQPDGRKSSEVFAGIIPKVMAGEAMFFEWVSLRSDGVPIDVEITLNRIELDDRPAIQAIVRDVTARKRHEEALSRAEKLEGLAIMAGGIAHEFNNLFTSVFGNLELIELGLARDSPARPRLLNIRLALQRAAGLSRQMLAFSGKGHFLAGAVDLNAVVAAHGRGLASTLPPSIRIECQLAEGLPPLKGDIRLIEQVLDALVQNAQEAMPPDGGAIRIATRLERLRGAVPGLQFPGGPFTPGAFVVLAVGDTGCGMSPELQAKAFDPFFTTKFTGRGLSLSAVLGILRVHDGGVQVQSAEGQGSLFTIYFPAGSAGCPRAFAELK